MAAIVPDYNTDQATKVVNSGSAYAPLKPNELSGRVRIAYFYYKPTVAIAADKVVRLTRLPAGARIIGGEVKSNAFVATSTLNVGLIGADGNGFIDKAGTVADSSSNNMFAALLAVATAGTYDFGKTIALNYGYTTDKEVDLIGEFKTAGMDGSADILQGHVLYVVD
jgi:hypothetical protein